MQVCVAVLSGLLLAGGPIVTSGPAADRSVPAKGWKYGAFEGRVLEARACHQAETSLESGASLLERGRDGSRLIAEGVGHAAYAPDGAILFVQDGVLVEQAGEKRKALAEAVEPDFAVSPDGSLLAIVRVTSRAEASAIELLPRSGGAARRLIAPEGLNGTPVFSPDGKLLVFSSTRTGIASFFRIQMDGSGLRQLTNVGLEVGTGAVLRADFVPPAENRHELRFVGPRVLEFRGGGGLRRLDVESGKASFAEATR